MSEKFKDPADHTSGRDIVKEIDEDLKTKIAEYEDRIKELETKIEATPKEKEVK